MKYEVAYYNDPSPDLTNANDGLLYTDDVLVDCSVLMLNLLNFNQAAFSSSQGQVRLRRFVVDQGNGIVQYNGWALLYRHDPKPFMEPVRPAAIQTNITGPVLQTVEESYRNYRL
jgi:hypothetical protein